MVNRHKVGKTLSYIFLGASSVIMISPVLYVVVGAFTAYEGQFEVVQLQLPNSLNLDIIQWAWSVVQGAYLVTLLRVAFFLTITLLVGLIGGYLFSKVRFPGRDKVFLLMLSGMVMPAILMILPQFIFMARFPLVGGNDLWGQGGHGFVGEWPVLFIYGWVPPFAIFFLKQSFDMLPSEYEDAAKLEGAGMFTIIFRVYGPMLQPAVAALVVITFLAVWNDYLWPSVTIGTKPMWYPIAYQLNNMVSDTPNPWSFMVILMASWPPALVYFLLQRYFVKGLVASGIKG